MPLCSSLRNVCGSDIIFRAVFFSMQRGSQCKKAFKTLNKINDIKNNNLNKTGPWWSSGLEHHSFVLVMLKVECLNPGIAVFFHDFDRVE